MAAYFKKHRVDLAHYPYPANPRWGNFPFKTLVTVHDTIPWQRPEYRRHLRSRLYQDNALKALLRADHLIAVSQTTADELQSIIIPSSGVATPPLSIIHEAADPVFNPKIQANKAPRPYFLYVGGYDPRKNVASLLEAYRRHIQPLHEVDLVLVGARDLSLARYVAFPETRALRESLQRFGFSSSRFDHSDPPARPRILSRLATKKATSQRLVNDYTPPSHQPDHSHDSGATSDQLKASLILTSGLSSTTLS